MSSVSPLGVLPEFEKLESELYENEKTRLLDGRALRLIAKLFSKNSCRMSDLEVSLKSTLHRIDAKLMTSYAEEDAQVSILNVLTKSWRAQWE